MVSNISPKLIECLRCFKVLITHPKLSSFEDEVPKAAWEDELGRLRIWAANIGAHQTGQSSLDYRLRDASHISQQVLKLLEDLRFTLGEVEEVLTNGPPSGNRSDEEDETEMQQLHSGLSNIIKCLYQMSMLIRKPARHDRLTKSRVDEAAQFQPFDRAHVHHKFPQADNTIVDRLGLAVSKRREDLRYRERHHMKLSQGIEHAQDESTPDAKSVVLSQTVATAFEDEDTQIHYEDSASMSGASQTSYAPSLEGGGTITVPPPPIESADARPFECPYCYFVITCKNRRTWTRHVFKDLLPYVCVFPNCMTQNKMYDSRHEWFEHELKYHLNGSIGPPYTTKVDCPLCKRPIRSIQLERHLARHLEELALFALPRNTDEEDKGSNKSRQQSPEAASVHAELSSCSNSDIEQARVGLDTTSEYHEKSDPRPFDLPTRDATDDMPLFGCPWPQCTRKGSAGFTNFDHLMEHRRRRHDETVFEGETSEYYERSHSPGFAPVVRDAPDTGLAHGIRKSQSTLSREDDPIYDSDDSSGEAERSLVLTTAEAERSHGEHRYAERPITVERKPQRLINADGSIQSHSRPRSRSEEPHYIADEDDVEEIIERRSRVSRRPSPYLHDFETRQAFERLMAFERAKTEEEALAKYREDLEVKLAKEQLEMIEEEEKQKELKKKAVEDWKREEDLKRVKGKKEEKDRITRSLPTYIRIHRKYILPETLDAFELPWEYDSKDTDYILIKKYINEEDQRLLFEHTRRIKERHRGSSPKNEEKGGRGRAEAKMAKEGHHAEDDDRQLADGWVGILSTI